MKHASRNWRKRSQNKKPLPAEPPPATPAVWEEAPVARHQFGATLMELFAELVLKAATSQRAAAAVLKIVARHLPGLKRIPCANSGRLWLMRLGLYALRCPKEPANDWAWIMDHTVQLGPWKALVIVGVRLSAWRAKQAPLEHEDLTLFDVTPMQQSSGEAVAARLRATMQESGVVPAAVLSDEGAELKKATALLREESPPLWKAPHVHDIKHKAAAILKKELHRDKTWQSFVTRTNRTKLQVTLTKLAFLVPPGLKNKARYMNLDGVVRWGCRALAFLDCPRDFPGQKLDRSRLRQKLGWLRAYRRPLAAWDALLGVAAAAESYVRRAGYHPAAAEELEKELLALGRTPACRRMKAGLVAFVAEQSKGLAPGQHLLGSSEVLESLLGKYKRIQGTHSKGGMTGSLLTLGAAVLTKSTAMVQTAMAAVPVAAVGQWVREKLGLTIPAQQALAFPRNKNALKTSVRPQFSF
jgi:hypothetical protein